MNDDMIQKLYINKPNKEVKLLCSYTTRKEGFLDILLSKTILSSKEAKTLFGKIKTHRSLGSKEDYSDMNDDISFSTGFVSFKYSNPLITKREDYCGGLGILVPLETILKSPRVVFSHCCEKGGIKDYNLNRKNIRNAVHMSRKKGELYDDGYGNVFEVALYPKLKKDELLSPFPKVISYPRLDLLESNDVIVAIPEKEKKSILVEVHQRQKEYGIFLDKISKDNPKKLQWKTVEGRELWCPEQTIEFMKRIVEPFDINTLPVFWYKQKNLDIALQYLAISGN